MVARHAATLATITKSKAFTKVNNAFSTIQKIATYQIPIPPPALPVAGGGVSVGSGTSFPILYPIAELGNNSGTITINLANQNLHYQKMNINAAGVSSVVFSGLLLNKAIVFTLDVTIGVAGVTALNWPANLYNLPTLPITNGSRYVLYISGFKDGSEERYEVVGSSLTGGGGSTNWSSIVIDVDKDMLNHSLSDLNTITFHSSTAIQPIITTDGADTNMQFNIHNYDILHLSNAKTLTVPNNGVAEIFGDGHTLYGGVLHVPSIKTVLNVTPTNGDLIGEVAFDSVVFDGITQKTFGAIFGKADVISNPIGTEEGSLQFHTMTNGSLTEKMILDYNSLLTLNNVSNSALNSTWIVFNTGGTDFCIRNLVDLTNNNIGHIFRINGTNYFQILHNASAPITDFLYANVPFNMNDHVIYNINGLQFDSSGTVSLVNRQIIGASDGFYFEAPNSTDKFRFDFQAQTKLTVDGRASTLSFSPGFYLQFLDGGNGGTISKLSGHSMWLSCIDGTQIDHFTNFLDGIDETKYLQIVKDHTSHNAEYNLVDPVNTSASHIFYVNSGNPITTIDHLGLTVYSNNNLAWYENHLIFVSGATNFSIHNFVDTTHTNIGQDYRINGTSILQLVHNTSIDPIDFIYAETPIWLSGYSAHSTQTSYIQFDGMSGNPTNPPVGGVRLYVTYIGGVAYLEAQFSDGTKLVLASH